MTKKDVKHEIEHKLLMLEFTMRVVANPPVDDMSKMMLRQADRIKAELAELRKLLKPQKSTSKRSTKKKRRK